MDTKIQIKGPYTRQGSFFFFLIVQDNMVKMKETRKTDKRYLI